MRKLILAFLVALLVSCNFSIFEDDRTPTERAIEEAKGDVRVAYYLSELSTWFEVADRYGW